MLQYLFFRFMVLVFKIIPFQVLYWKADFLNFLLYRVFKYRVKVVRKNLKNSFPEKTVEELRQIEKAFYKNLSQITVESLKGFSMSPEQLKAHYKVVNPEVLQAFYDKGQSVIGVGSHFANWEWGVLAFGLQFPHKCIGFYKPLSNSYIDDYIKKSRAVWGMHLKSIRETAFSFEEKQERPSIYIMIGDQNPSNIKKAHWVDFLNQDTACLHGIDLYSRLYNYPVIYGEVQRIKRSYYEVKISVLTENPREYKEGEITMLVMKHLESIIRKKPQDWLWSHKRWKHKK